MPIPVTCQCGQSFAAGDHLAGRTVQCPKCKSPLTIPAPQAASMAGPLGGPSPAGPSIFEDAGMRTYTPGKPLCPSCQAELLPNAVLCVKCGYHLQKGRKIGDASVSTGAHDGHSDAAVAALRRAASVIDQDKEEAKKQYKQGMPWWALAGIFLFAMCFLIGMLYLPGEQAFFAGGMTIASVCSLVSLYHGIRILMIAFADSVIQGLCCLLIPCYGLIYVIMHWDTCGGHFLWQLMMTIIGNVIGGGMVAAAPLMRPKPDGQVFFDRSPPAVVYVLKDDERSPLPRPLITAA